MGATRNVVLTDHQVKLIERLLASGRYQNASEVLREGLRLIESRDAEEKAKLQSLREAARAGLADIDSGRFRTFTETDALGDYLTTLAEKAIKGPASAKNPR